MIAKKRSISFLATAFLSVLLFACQPSWQIELKDTSSATTQITHQDVMFYIEKSTEPIEAVPFGQILYHHGYTLVENITLETSNGKKEDFLWDEIAHSAFIANTGEIRIGSEYFKPVQITVKRADFAAKIDYSILDIAPTITFALGLPELEDSPGKIRTTSTGEWEHAVLILLDGLQYDVLETAINEGRLSFFQQMGMPKKGLTIYPPISNTASAAVLTGTPPQINAVYGYGDRATTQITLFDLAVGDGMRVAAIEGASLPFNLRNAETTLSGDRDGDGFSDDNVYSNSLSIIQNDMPDLLYIHFHEIDDMGHTYGPDSSQYLEALQRVNGYLTHIVDALPKDTFIAIFADHGMHATIDGGNHGTLIEEDLVIPIIFLEK